MTESGNLSRRRFLQATGGAATAAALAGCGGSGGSTTTNGGNNSTMTGTTTSGSSSGSRVNSVEASVTTFDPVAETDTESGRVVQQLFDSLFQYPQGVPNVTKELAKDFSVSSDYTTYTFTLRDATYHDQDTLDSLGLDSTVTASDFVYAWERLAAADHTRRANFILESVGVKHETDSDGNYKPGTLAVTAKDDTTLEVELEQPFHAAKEMFAYTYFSPVPKNLVGDVPGYDGKMDYNTFASDTPIGAGPFSLKNYSKGTEVLLERFDDYYGTTAATKELHWQIIEAGNAAYEYVMNENADVFTSSSGIPTSKYDPSKVHVDHTTDQGQQVGTYGPLRNGKTVNYVGVPTLNTYYIGFNMSKVPKPVRQAFAHAMNQESMVQNVFKGRGSPAYFLTPPGIFPGGAKAAEQKAKNDYPYGYNESQIAKARQVMEKAGYSASNKFDLTFTLYKSDTWKQMAKTLRDQLASAHISMNIQEAPFSTLMQRGRNGQLEAYTMGWIAGWPAPDNFLQLLNPPASDTSQKAPTSYVNWNSNDGDAAQKAANAWQSVQNHPTSSSSDQQARNQAYLDIETANWEDVAYLNVYHGLKEVFWYDDVQGLEPFGSMGFYQYKLNEVHTN